LTKIILGWQLKDCQPFAFLRFICRLMMEGLVARKACYKDLARLSGPVLMAKGKKPEKIVRSDTPSAQAIDVPSVETTEILAALGAVIHVGFQAEITLAL
jgi:hypothetical protein